MDVRACGSMPDNGVKCGVGCVWKGGGREDRNAWLRRLDSTTEQSIYPREEEDKYEKEDEDGTEGRGRHRARASMTETKTGERGLE